jgi:hypothetical protein
MVPSSLGSWRAIACKVSFGALLAALPLATQLGGCVALGDEERACTLIGCQHEIDFELAPASLVRGAACAWGPLVVRACADAVCDELTIAASGECEAGGFGLEPSLVCADLRGRPPGSGPPPDTLHLWFALGLDDRQDWSGARVASVSLRTLSGEVLYEGQQGATFDPVYPNGQACDVYPCWHGRTVSFDASTSLSGFGEGCGGGLAGAGGAGGTGSTAGTGGEAGAGGGT